MARPDSYEPVELAGEDLAPPAQRPPLVRRVPGLSGLTRPGVLLAAGAAIAVAAACATWMLSRDDSPSPADLLSDAFALLDGQDDPSSRRRALDLARQLEGEDYRAPDFAGALFFIEGIVAFRDAQDADEPQRERQYLIAERMLRECESRALVAHRRPEWAFALGMSLHRLGKASEARPLLEEAVRTWPAGRIEASISLTDIYLDLKTPGLLEQALALNQTVIDNPGLDSERRDRAMLQRAQVLFGLDRSAEAEEILRTSVADEASGNLATTVLRARTLMAERRFAEALELLRPVAGSDGLEQTYPRQALYLMGVCATELGDSESAIAHFERTSEWEPRSHEGLAASVRAGALLRKAGRHEESLDAYQRALQQVVRVEDFRNRWLGIDDFRSEILAAWNGWVEAGAFEQAIALASRMTPLLPEMQAADLSARAQQRWAENLSGEFAAATVAGQRILEPRLRARWRASGEAFARLAGLSQTLPEHAEALWASAEHYRQGHDLERALEQYTRFINTRPAKLLSLAILRRGETLFDLGRLDDALAHFERIVEAYPGSPVAFEAAYLIGACRLERNEPDEAERAWRALLASAELTPAAREWRNALFSLGKLLYDRAALAAGTNDSLGGAAATPAERAKREAESVARTLNRWEEAVSRLAEFVERYSDDPRTIEARYLLARALGRAAELHRRSLERAETDNARREEHRRMLGLLERADAELHVLQRDLSRLDEDGRLDELGSRILRSVNFELGHNAYAREAYDDALTQYALAANRYPQSPQTLVAYVQMTNCYSRLHRPAEARSMVEQARVIIQGLPERSFDDPGTNLNRAEWIGVIERLRRLQPQISYQ